MRASLVLAIASLTALAGCVDAMMDGIDEPQESTEGFPVEGGPTPPTEELDAPTPASPTPVSTTPPTATSPPPATPPSPPPPEPTPPPSEPTPPPPTEPTPPPPSEPTPPPPTEPTPAPTEPTPPPPTEPTPPPPTEPTPPSPTPWPREGSTVTFRVVTFEGAPDGSFEAHVFTNATWTYRDGDWHGTCDGTRHSRVGDGPFQIEDVHSTFEASSPPHWPLLNTRSPPAEGAEVDAWTMWSCEIVKTVRAYDGMHDGSHRARETAEQSAYSDFVTTWDAATGLVEHWEDQRRNSRSEGWLVSTDAPLS